MPTWHSTNGSQRNSENKEKTKDTKKGRQNAGDLFLVYKHSKRFGLIKMILVIYILTANASLYNDVQD